MTNPNDAIGVNAAYGTRTSVNAFNDIAQVLSGRGILSGWAVNPKGGMILEVGGVAGVRDVAVGEDNLGNRICLNNRLSNAISVTIPAASASSARYDAIVVYANNPAQAADTTPDAPSVCGIIVASGGGTGVSDAQIRSAITADGGTGLTAYYAVIAQVYVGAGATDITSTNITQNHVSISASDIADGEITGNMIDWSTMPAELVYSYTQESDSSSEVTKDILLDWSKYKAFHAFISFEMLSGSGWVTQQLLSSTKAATSSRQRGWEAGGSTFSGVTRTVTTGAIVACESTTGNQSWFDITLIKMGNSKSVGSNSAAAGSETSQSLACSLWSSETTPPPYLRAHLLNPKAGAFIKVYGYR